MSLSMSCDGHNFKKTFNLSCNLLSLQKGTNLEFLQHEKRMNRC